MPHVKNGSVENVWGNILLKEHAYHPDRKPICIQGPSHIVHAKLCAKGRYCRANMLCFSTLWHVNMTNLLHVCHSFLKLFDGPLEYAQAPLHLQDGIFIRTHVLLHLSSGDDSHGSVNLEGREMNISHWTASSWHPGSPMRFWTANAKCVTYLTWKCRKCRNSIYTPLYI